MASTEVTFFSLNIGMSSSLAGLVHLVQSESLDVIFLQEVRSTKVEIENQLPGFCAAVNIDSLNPTRPGTAIVWRHSIPVTDVLSLSTCRLQVASLNNFQLINIYAPSGSDRKRERESFYAEEVFDILQLGKSDA